jgi:hypothetical protein
MLQLLKVLQDKRDTSSSRVEQQVAAGSVCSTAVSIAPKRTRVS